MLQMQEEKEIVTNKNAKIALAAMFSAMAAVMTLLKITIPFPILPYLEIDLTEIPVILSFYLLNPMYGLVTATIYWIILTIRAGDLVGPAMKYFAVVSLIVGYWLVNKFNVENKRVKLLLGLVLGGILRVVVMSVVNYVVIMYVAPFYLDFITGLLGAAGLPNSTTFEVMTWTLIITGFYNLAHGVFSIVPAYYLTGLIKKRLS